jgi:hypothetical protein
VKNQEIEFEGEIKNNVITGFGKCTFRDDDKAKIYKGFFENGEPNGEGTLVVDDEEVRNGNWFNGYFVRYKGFNDE